ncbi:MAG TPA: hypothetical protein VHF58_10105 [Solirubrobacterales bacterium]|nr:hypothetical protein [Solirubrobacterales bacterium]
MPPTNRPYPRFIGDASREGRPYGRWEERLREAFVDECRPLAAEAGSELDPMTVKWFPDRSWGGRTYVPASGRAGAPTASEDGESILVEYFGWVSFAADDDEAEPADLRAKADFTDVTAEDNPDWKIDLNDDVLGRWRTDGGRAGDVTLIWGLPLVRGAVVATAEIESEVVDQAAVNDGRFTLLAVDAIEGFPDDLYVTVRLWDRAVREVASETLYADPAGEEPETDEPEPGAHPAP